MFEEREFEGKDLEQALHTAAEVLGIPEPELDYEIVEQGRRGLFGVGAKSVRIRVMPPLASVPDPLSAVSDAPQDGRAPAVESAPRREPERVRAAASAPRVAAPAAETGDIARVLQRILHLMGLEIEARGAAADGAVAIELDGPDREALTKKDGDLLQALQFLMNRMARRSWPEAGPIRLSCNGGAPDRRDDELVEQAREAAEQVRRTGRTQRLPPMNAYERRLVHLTVREYERLGSRSEGNGPLKRVKIFKQA